MVLGLKTQATLLKDLMPSEWIQQALFILKKYLNATGIDTIGPNV